MKRTALTRKTGLERRTPLDSRSELKRTPLKPISDKQRARKREDAARVEAEGAAFHAAILGERCVVCGRTDAQAREKTGYGHQAHHGVRQEVLKRLGLHHLLWDKRNAVCACEEPCHRRHTSRHRRILRAELPERVLAFAVNEGLERELDREYPE